MCNSLTLRWALESNPSSPNGSCIIPVRHEQQATCRLPSCKYPSELSSGVAQHHSIPCFHSMSATFYTSTVTSRSVGIRVAVLEVSAAAKSHCGLAHPTTPMTDLQKRSKKKGKKGQLYGVCMSQIIGDPKLCWNQECGATRIL